LNEICVADDSNYLKRVMISVREKKVQQTATQKYPTSNSDPARRSILTKTKPLA
jgi:hypothetical protein